MFNVITFIHDKNKSSGALLISYTRISTCTYMCVYIYTHNISCLLLLFCCCYCLNHTQKYSGLTPS